MYLKSCTGTIYLLRQRTQQRQLLVVVTAVNETRIGINETVALNANNMCAWTIRKNIYVDCVMINSNEYDLIYLIYVINAYE